MTVIHLFFLILVLGTVWAYLQISDEIFQLLAVVVGLACSVFLLAAFPWPAHVVLLALLVALDLPLLKQLK